MKDKAKLSVFLQYGQGCILSIIMTLIHFDSGEFSFNGDGRERGCKSHSGMMQMDEPAY